MKAGSLVLMLVLCGCTASHRTATETRVLEPPEREDTYSRAEIDAINAEAQCKLHARTMIEISRCSVPRR